MTSQQKTPAYEIAFPTGTAETPQSVWARLLDALRAEHPTASLPDQEGLCEATAEDSSLIRYGHHSQSGFWAVEVFSPSRQDHWSAYFLPMPDGTWRTGWLRTGALDGHEPSCWLDVVAHLQLGHQVRPQHPPSFLALIAALSSPGAPQFAQIDQHTIDAITVELDEQRRIIRDQGVMLRGLRHSLTNLTGAQQEAPSPRIWTLADIGEWATENADRIVIMPRAISETKKSLYEDPDLLYAALDILADVYPRVRSGELPRDTLLNRCRELNLSIGGSVEPTRAGEAGGDEYFVRWRGRRRFLEQHMGKGVSRDPRHTLRIYFFFDEEQKVVVCGHLPSHLSNSRS